MKRVTLLLLALLLPISVWAKDQPAYETGVTLALSSGVSSSFLHSKSGTQHTWANRQRQRVTIWDSLNRSLVFFVGSTGTGETLGAELVDSWTNNGYETFTPGAGNVITQAVNSAGSGLAYKQSALETSRLYKFDSTFALSSGSLPDLAGLGWDASHIAQVVPVLTGRNIVYMMLINETYDYVHLSTTVNGDFAVTSFSFKEVFTPSASGCSAYSSPALVVNSTKQKATNFNTYTAISAVPTYKVLIEDPQGPCAAAGM